MKARVTLNSNLLSEYWRRGHSVDTVKKLLSPAKAGQLELAAELRESFGIIVMSSEEHLPSLDDTLNYTR